MAQLITLADRAVSSKFNHFTFFKYTNLAYFLGDFLKGIVGNVHVGCHVKWNDGKERPSQMQSCRSKTIKTHPVS